jgi:hypothetical protein
MARLTFPSRLELGVESHPLRNEGGGGWPTQARFWLEWGGCGVQGSLERCVGRHSRVLFPSHREAKGGAFDFFHHKRPVSAITDTQPSRCDDATMIAD